MADQVVESEAPASRRPAVAPSVALSHRPPSSIAGSISRHTVSSHDMPFWPAQPPRSPFAAAPPLARVDSSGRLDREQLVFSLNDDGHLAGGPAPRVSRPEGLRMRPNG